MAVNIKPNRAAGLQKIGASQLVQAKIEAALTQIENDNTQLTADLAAIAAADNATMKQITGRIIQGLIRNNNRQKRIIQFLARD